MTLLKDGTTHEFADGGMNLSANGKSIFLPASGHFSATTLHQHGTYGCYWTSKEYLDAKAFFLGFGTADVARYFRINTGISQSDTAVNTEANLALALSNYGSEVEYSFVWGQEHTMAEESGDSTPNFIDWVNSCCRGEGDGSQTS